MNHDSSGLNLACQRLRWSNRFTPQLNRGEVPGFGFGSRVSGELWNPREGRGRDPLGGIARDACVTSIYVTRFGVVRRGKDVPISVKTSRGDLTFVRQRKAAPSIAVSLVAALLAPELASAQEGTPPAAGAAIDQVLIATGRGNAGD